jgi:hypothetical protein
LSRHRGQTRRGWAPIEIAIEIAIGIAIGIDASLLAFKWLRGLARIVDFEPDPDFDFDAQGAGWLL